MIRTNDSQMTTDPYQPNHRLFKLLLDLGQPLTRGSARHLLPSPMAPLPTIITGQTHSLTPPGMMAMILKMNLGRSLDHCKTRDPSGDDSTVFLGLHNLKNKTWEVDDGLGTLGRVILYVQPCW